MRRKLALVHEENGFMGVVDDYRLDLAEEFYNGFNKIAHENGIYLIEATLLNKLEKVKNKSYDYPFYLTALSMLRIGTLVRAHYSGSWLEFLFANSSNDNKPYLFITKKTTKNDVVVFIKQFYNYSINNADKAILSTMPIDVLLSYKTYQLYNFKKNTSHIYTSGYSVIGLDYINRSKLFKKINSKNKGE